jgi:Protein of unknown function (DUF1588)/Protein of unknown function (DUF1592)/Protein of unknown function (DUF1585)/Protein of unknown function (DUF1595)
VARRQQFLHIPPSRPSRIVPGIRSAVLPLFAVAVLAGSLSANAGVNAAKTRETEQALKIEEPQASSLARVRLMTREQYANLLSYIFGPDIRVALRSPPVTRTEGLNALGASTAGVTPTGVEQFKRTATSVADQVVDNVHRSYLIPCKPHSPKDADAACARKFLASVGRLLYRRPLTEGELTSIVGEAGAQADKLGDFYAGLSLVLGTMLYDPEFLFIADQTEPDPVHPGQLRLTGYALATRLSLLLWNSTPDDYLLRAAERGELYDAKARARIVGEMLASPRFETGIRAFFDDMLGFLEFDTVSKDPLIYPTFAGIVAKDAREQALLTVVHQLVTEDGDYRDLFTSRDTFISPELAPLYGIPAPSVGWTEYEFPADSPRVGFLTQIAFLSMYAHPGRSSATKRGRALREALLCQKVPDPPPNVDFSLFEDPKTTFRTARDRLTAHRKNPVCAGCHKITDPIGLALENFDGAGQFRAEEKGAVIDASGALDGKEFSDAVGLGKALHDHPALPACLVSRFYAYALGGPAPAQDREVVDYFEKRFAAGGYRVPQLLKAIALSRAISEVHTSASGALTAGTH